MATKNVRLDWIPGMTNFSSISYEHPSGTALSDKLVEIFVEFGSDEIKQGSLVDFAEFAHEPQVCVCRIMAVHLRGEIWTG